MALSGRAIDGESQSAITKLRKEGLSQRIIAERLGLSRRTVQKYFSAERSVSTFESGTVKESAQSAD